MKNITEAQQSEDFIDPTKKVSEPKGRSKRRSTVTAAKLYPGNKKMLFKISKTFFTLEAQILLLKHVSYGGANEETVGKH